MNQFLITTICSTMAGLHNPACINATKAAFIQTNFDGQLNEMQTNLKTKLNTLNPNSPIFTYLGVAYKIGIDKKINYTVNNLMACDKLNFGLDTTSVIIGVEWKL